jgi:hypothetical protein
LPKGKKPKKIDTHSLPKSWAKKFIEDKIPSVDDSGKKQIQLDSEVVDHFRELVDSIATTILHESIRVSLRSRSRLSAETLDKVTKAWLGEVGPK